MGLLTNLMSRVRARLADRGPASLALRLVDELRFRELRSMYRVLGAGATLRDALGSNPFLLREDARILARRDGMWLRVRGAWFLLNEATWPLLTSDFEGPELALLDAWLPRAGRFLDVGANFGLHSIVAAVERPALVVDAFEPVPETFDLLVRNVGRNELANVRPRRIALAASSGRAFMTRTFTTGNRLLPEGRTQTGPEAVEVETATLDEVWHADGRPHVDLVKVDVEGGEWDVLRGGSEMLRAERPPLLVELSETWLARFGKSRADCLRLLGEYGYRAIREPGAGALWHDLDTYAFGESNNYFICEERRAAPGGPA